MNYTNNFAKAGVQPYILNGMTELLSQAYSWEKVFEMLFMTIKFHP
jgi:hypothetical protein